MNISNFFHKKRKTTVSEEADKASAEMQVVSAQADEPTLPTNEQTDTFADSPETPSYRQADTEIPISTEDAQPVDKKASTGENEYLFSSEKEVDNFDDEDFLERKPNIFSRFFHLIGRSLGKMGKLIGRYTPLSRLDRYIIAKFLGTYFFILALIILIAVVFDYNQNIDKFTTNHAPWNEIIFDYYANFVPYFSNLFSPLFVFIAVIFFTAKLADHSEIIAMMSTGMSFNRLLRPYMISAAFIAILTFWLGGYIIPNGNVSRLNFENIYKKKKRPNFAQNVQLQVDTGVIAFIGQYEDPRKTGFNFSLDKFVNKKLISHLTAQAVSYDTLADERYHWTIKGYTIREMKGRVEHITHGEQLDSIIMMEPSDFLQTRNQQETMTNPALREYVAKQKMRGAANVVEFEVEYHKRIASSFAAFVLTTIGLSLSSRKRKGGMGLYLGIGLALSFAYILFQTISSTFAINAGWPASIAVWIPNILYLFIALFVYKRAPR